MSRILLGITGFSIVLLMGCSAIIAQVPAFNQTFDPAKLPQGQYRIDPAHASVNFRVNHMGFSHYMGRFNEIEGELEFDPSQPEKSSIHARISTESIDVPHEGLQKKLKGSTWFDAEKYPLIEFQADGIERIDERKGRLKGLLTLHGVTNPQTLDVTFNGGAHSLLDGAYKLGFSASGALSRSAYGIRAYPNLVGDEVKILIEVEFTKILENSAKGKK